MKQRAVVFAAIQIPVLSRMTLNRSKRIFIFRLPKTDILRIANLLVKYYFLEGYAKFGFEGESFETWDGDAVFVPSNMPYHVEGWFKAVLVYSPPFETPPTFWGDTPLLLMTV
jgi:hypothetical protein